jgi:DNA-binding beta-propeller fold protein YncE
MGSCLRTAVCALVIAVLAAGCTTADRTATPDEAAAPSRTPALRSSGTSPSATARRAPRAPTPPAFQNLLPGMPAVVGDNVYAATRAGALAARVRHDPALVYVPDSSAFGSTVTVISQRTHKVVRTLHVGLLSQHVTPSYDLRHLYTNSSESNELVEIDPRTARVTRRITVPRPYNLYFTPDGRQAVVMVEQHDIIRFSDPHTFKKRNDVHPRGCLGPNHADFSANGRFMVVTCEFSHTLVKLSTTKHTVLDTLRLPAGSMPQDIRLSPDGKVFYLADMGADQVRIIDAARLVQIGAVHTPPNPHGLYPSRDGRRMYISDRGAGKVSVLSFRTNRIVDTWTIPGGGSPDMGGVSADGKELWLSGRNDGEVYAFDTRTGRLKARIRVPGHPHGLCVWPQPGRYSLGHTGNMR